jgi:hypothetical protein
VQLVATYDSAPSTIVDNYEQRPGASPASEERPVAPPLPWTQHRTLSLLILVGAVAAFAAFKPPPDRTVAAETVPAAAPADPADQTPPSWAFATPVDGDYGAPASDSAGNTNGTRITGKVLEQIDVAKYSYLRLGIEGGSDTWTAVPVTTLRVGQSIVVSNAEQMTNFSSATLKRKFDVIYFGVLDSPEAPAEAQALPDLAAFAPMNDPHRTELRPHPGPGKEADAVPLAKSEKAPGPLGRTVAEINALDQAAAESRVRVRATVVKVTTGVMGRTFVHLRDGSGTAPLTYDLTATTTEDLSVGTEALLEGRVEIDKDFGAGYRYRVLLAEAWRVRP